MTTDAATRSRFEHARTTRLSLDIPIEADLVALYELHKDPRSWSHNPGRRHTSPDKAREFITSSRARFVADGLSYWCVREHGSKKVIGWAGCSIPTSGHWWNLTYRIHPDYWGRGYAVEAADAAVTAAHATAPHIPVLAFLVEHNTASKIVAERCGLSLVLYGPDKSLPEATRLIYLDRDPTDSEVAAIAESMFPSGTYTRSTST